MRSSIPTPTCIGCGRPCRTAFCDSCAPPDPARFGGGNVDRGVNCDGRDYDRPRPKASLQRDGHLGGAELRRRGGFPVPARS